MAKHILILGILFLIVSCKQTKEKSFEKQSKSSKFAENPDDIKLITSDIDLFWESYDKLLKDTINNSFEAYLRNGSIGLKDFVPDRIESAEKLKELVLSEKQYYSNIRSSSYKILNFKKQIIASCYALEYVYPEAVFPPVYFLIGRTTSGGTASKNGLMIALEVYSDGNFTTDYGRPSLDIEIMPNIVIHELIHFLQKDNPKDETLLKHCIREGTADFIAELVSGEKTRLANGPDVYPYGEKNEQELWIEFNNSRNSKELSPWLYSQTPDGRPQNLGYWMGYKIVEAYYQKSNDKKKALLDILNIDNYDQFLEQSEYSKKFE
ncbi:hypothetical protein ATO12_17795 [Aquimarina atlantica]|uniref:Uncharacterized protein n=1 Tax=Aquimarina atlantica TaxID=1317122 RepID=A0A023BUV7_9FLAO|nr:DUF2268 domain-containing putative Zn-dependent protease [Aquimarina atlantica]EZH73786.1 hypothetical protein ATO12_17795 [Aquimarina atlantica]